ncbi:hypothetical protein PHMEG_0006836 [Phytophthora megakarya]|uniref:Retrotransposon gag domain-containing protein n=1 Tax=Phytophthora megakarya TaxID=4795 RepID=A0A225WN98_9STRA|nr:hypothetical protein PHMEG_0006836 [Phytophthora megakarya]
MLYRKEHPTATFEDAGDALIARFRPNLTGQEITARIYTEGKRASETYQEYSDRLLQMADGLVSGIGNTVNVQHSMVHSCDWLDHNVRISSKHMSMGKQVPLQAF